MNQIELRIGNWYNFANPMEGGKLYPTQFTLWAECLDFEAYGEPIPLTPEILQSCGFVDMKKNVDVWDAGIQVCRLPATGTYYFCIADGSTLSIINESEFMYVHQLQDLYRILAGKELNINL